MALHFGASLGYGVIGNTTDSGPVILGSSPGIPTEKNGTKARSANLKSIHKYVLGYGVIGNTTDSGPVILGSSPGIPTENKAFRAPLGRFFH